MTVGQSRFIVLAIVTTVVMSVAALATVVLACVTLFMARRMYAAIATGVARGLLRTWQVGVEVHRDTPWPTSQVVYISNHSSTLDLFALVALGLPNTRFFLSGFLRYYGPLGVFAMLMGTFFTVPQAYPDTRRRI